MYIRRTAYHMITKAMKWVANGCNTYSFYNQGNTNITINNVLVLRPGQLFSGPNEHPEIKDFSAIDIQFDIVNDPGVVQPDTGPNPKLKQYLPGDPIPEKDNRLIIFESFIVKQ